MLLQPLGDQAWMATFADEDAAAAFAVSVRGGDPSWLVDVVQAYRSVAVFFDADRATLAVVEAWLRGASGVGDNQRQAAEPAASHSGLLRNATRPGARRGAHGIAARRGHSAAHVLRLHDLRDRLLSGVSVPGILAAGVERGAAPGIAAGARRSGQRRHDGEADGHLHGAATRRLEPDRPHAAAAR